jgi:CPA2 family monovalent cation:H+ antiporter-2
MTHGAQSLPELLLVTGFSLAVLLLFQRLRLPPAVGFIVTGVLIGPGGFGLVRSPGLVRALADFGVMLLLFTVGLEFSREELRRLRRPALVGGAVQVGLTGALVALAVSAVGLHPAQAILFGMLASLSSTALVLRLLTDRLELASPHGRAATGILIFQDLLVIPLAVLIPWLGRWQAGAGGGALPELPVLGALAQVAMVALLFGLARRVAPWLLLRTLRTHSREAFLFGVVAVVLGSAYLTSRLGLSVALGAFLAGLVLAESELRSHVEAQVVSFRDALTGVFFVAIGMLFEPRAVVTHPVVVLGSTVGLVVLKAAGAAAALRLAGAPWRVALAAGFTLAQVGEFSFMLAAAAPPLLLGDVGGQAFFAGAVFSLVLTPWLVSRAPEWSHALARRLGADGATEPPGALPELRSHVVIAGFGLNGRNLARVLRSVRLPHVVVDLDPDALQSPAAAGSPLLLGDVAHPETQRRAGVPGARVLVLALSDPVATRHACRVARSLAPQVFIVVRTRYVAEIDELYRLGASQVVPEEFETSIEIFTAVLRHFHVPTNVVHAEVQLLRQERYSLLRGLPLPRPVLEQLDAILQEGTCDTFILLQHSPAVGRTLRELGLRGERGARVVARVRGGVATAADDGDEVLQVGDILVMTGTHAQMEEAFRRLSPSG